MYLRVLVIEVIRLLRDCAHLEVGHARLEGTAHGHEVRLHEDDDHEHVALVLVQDVRRHHLALPPEREARCSLAGVRWNSRKRTVQQEPGVLDKSIALVLITVFCESSAMGLLVGLWLPSDLLTCQCQR